MRFIVLPLAALWVYLEKDQVGDGYCRGSNISRKYFSENLTLENVDNDQDKVRLLNRTK